MILVLERKLISYIKFRIPTAHLYFNFVFFHRFREPPFRTFLSAQWESEEANNVSWVKFISQMSSFYVVWSYKNCKCISSHRGKHRRGPETDLEHANSTITKVLVENLRVGSVELAQEALPLLRGNLAIEVDALEQVPQFLLGGVPGGVGVTPAGNSVAERGTYRKETGKRLVFKREMH